MDRYFQTAKFLIALSILASGLCVSIPTFADDHEMTAQQMEGAEMGEENMVIDEENSVPENMLSEENLPPEMMGTDESNFMETPMAAPEEAIEDITGEPISLSGTTEEQTDSGNDMPPTEDIMEGAGEEAETVTETAPEEPESDKDMDNSDNAPPPEKKQLKRWWGRPY